MGASKRDKSNYVPEKPGEEFTKGYIPKEIDESNKWDEKYVIDRVAYEKWKKASEVEILRVGKNWECSDGTVVNLGHLTHIVREQVAHLPKEEYNKILDKQIEYRSAFGRCTQYRLIAYGRKIASNGYGFKQSNHLKALDEHRSALVELFGRMFSPEEVFRIIIEEFKIPCSLDAVVEFRKIHINQITHKIEDFKRGAVDTRLGIKKGRIEELVWLYQRTKNKFVSTDSRFDREFLLKILDNLRKETDGDILKIEGNLDLKVESVVNMHLKEEILGKLNLGHLILSRVAARMGVNPLRIMVQLQSSLHSKYNGLLGNVQDAEYTEMRYPSSEVYDFDKIGQNYEVITKKDLELQAKLEREGNQLAETTPKDAKEVLLAAINDKIQTNRLRGAEIDQIALDAKVDAAEAKVASKKSVPIPKKKVPNVTSKSKG